MAREVLLRLNGTPGTIFLPMSHNLQMSDGFTRGLVGSCNANMAVPQ